MTSYPFGVTWNLLKLLGANLYSHPWSAVSELVANGIDAGATSIWIHLNISTAADNCILEVLDNGAGMSRAQISNYAVLGYNKRNDESVSHADQPMGRKGVGKLAALYLSNTYLVLTKAAGSEALCLQAKGEQDQQTAIPHAKSGASGEDVPSLKETDTPLETELYHVWRDLASGTLIQIPHVDLTGFGEKAFEGLRKRLAYQFLIDSLDNVDIQVKTTTDKGSGEYESVAKDIAFGNLMAVRKFFNHESDEPLGLRKIKTTDKVFIEFAGGSKRSYASKSKQQVEIPVSVGPFEDGRQHSIAGNLDSHPDVPYSLTGWIGLHASIKNELAKKNDRKFGKNRYHNPCQIRLYVRDKLAVSNLTPYLRQASQQYANYLEGEVSFDVLDDDALDDIATTSREGFDQTDARFALLIELVEEQVANLFNDREKITKELKEDARKEAEEEAHRAARAKREYVASIANTAKRNRVDEVAMSAIRRTAVGGLSNAPFEVKPDRGIFLSHASRSRALSDLVYALLRGKGVNTQTEVFYTSDSQGTAVLPNKALDLQIHEWLVSRGIKPIFFTSAEFRNSEYCLIEAGAAWALKSTDEIEVLTTRYEECPQYLANPRLLIPFLDPKTEEIQLSRETYLELIRITNAAIDHLNEGRRINGLAEIEKYVSPVIPDKLELHASGKSIEEYFDSEVLRLFQAAQEDWKRTTLNQRKEESDEK